MSDPSRTTLDHIDNISVPGAPFEEPANEYWALVCLWRGMCYLNEHVAECERIARESIESGKDLIFSPALQTSVNVEGLMLYGRLPESIRNATSMLTMAFHWYAVSACQYVRLIGSIAKREDNDRPLSKDYAQGIIPEVVVFRDKVAAHFSWASENRRDNDAERLASILPPLSYAKGLISVGGMTLSLRRGDNSSSSESIKEWSLTEVHQRLAKRYFPSASETQPETRRS